jgi:hypothetical protein
MSTWLRLLKLTFWMWPLQRVATVLGLGVLMFPGAALLGGTSYGYDWLAFGSLAAFGMPALFGGAFWRALSAPRSVQLAPAGRVRLLLAAAGIVATIALIWLAWQWLFDLGVEPRFRTDLVGYRGLFVGVIAAATWWGLASFIASRSPLAMLLVLIFTFTSAWLWDRYATGVLPQLWRQPWSIALPLLLWAAFGTWYLRTRRIRPPGWLLPGSQSVIAAVAMAETVGSGLSRRVALERLLLGGSSVLRLLAQWLLVGGMLLAILLLLARQGEQESRSVAHMSFAALILCPVIVAALAAGVIDRARGLWLPSGLSRTELLAHTETVLLKLTVGLWLLFAGFLALLWYTQPWRPGLTLVDAMLVLLLPSLLLATHALTRPHGFDYYWSWPIVLLLCLFNCWQLLITWNPQDWFDAGATSYMLSSIVTLSDPLIGVEPHPWVWSALAGVATIGFHLMARHRWLAEDLPRVPAQAAS